MQNNGIQQVIVRATDWVSGLFSGIEYKDYRVDFTNYLSNPELQRVWFETQACASFSYSNCVETQMNLFLERGAWTDTQVQEMRDLGYIENNHFNFSDRFIAEGSGTGLKGNELQKVLDFGRKQGMVGEKDWPMPANGNWDMYYEDLPENLKEKAKKFLEYAQINYEWVLVNKKENVVEVLSHHLKHAPIQVATHICPLWETGNVPACPDLTLQHAYMVYKVDNQWIYVIDQYPPFQKKLALDYPILWGLKIVVIPKPFKRNLYYGLRGDDVKLLQKKLGVIQTGFFGILTLKAVQEFQKKNGIYPVLGFCGKTTQRHLSTHFPSLI